MPISLPTFVSSFETSLRSSGLNGSMISQMSTALGSGMASIMATSVQVSTVDAGTSGVGTGYMVGIITTKKTDYTQMVSNLHSNGVSGSYANNLANALSDGVLKNLLSCAVSTTHPIVGSGSGTVKFTMNPLQALPILQQSMASSGINGESSMKIANAFVFSLSSILSLTSMIIPIVGPTGGVSFTGIGSGKIV